MDAKIRHEMMLRGLNTLRSAKVNKPKIPARRYWGDWTVNISKDGLVTIGYYHNGLRRDSMPVDKVLYKGVADVDSAIKAVIDMLERG